MDLAWVMLHAHTEVIELNGTQIGGTHLQAGSLDAALSMNAHPCEECVPRIPFKSFRPMPTSFGLPYSGE